MKLSPLPEEKINGRAVVGIKVEVDGQWQNDLYFDKSNGFLVKTVKSAPKPGALEPVRTETVFDDYKEADGVQLPRKIAAYQDGKKTLAVTITELKCLDKVDDKTFSKP